MSIYSIILLIGLILDVIIAYITSEVKYLEVIKNNPIEYSYLYSKLLVDNDLTEEEVSPNYILVNSLSAEELKEVIKGGI